MQGVGSRHILELSSQIKKRKGSEQENYASNLFSARYKVKNFKNHFQKNESITKY